MAITGTKQKNRRKIYHYIRQSGPVSKQDMVMQLQLSLPTVSKNVEYLESHELVHSEEKFCNTGGRNAAAYAYVKDAKLAIGVDVTKNHLKAVLVDLSGEVLDIVRWRRSFDKTEEHLKDIGRVVQEIVRRNNVREDKILGVGIAVPGLVSEDGECVTYGLVIPLTGTTRETLARYVPYENRLFHDAHAAGYAEIWSSSEIDTAFYINLCNSVGGSVVIDKKNYMGETYKSSEIGHMTLDPHSTRQCYCGKYGCTETYCNVGVLTDGSLADFFEQVEAKDETTLKLWNEYVENLAIAINNVRVLFDCKIIIGGFLGAHIGKHMQTLQQAVGQRGSFGDNPEEFILSCKCTVEAVASGAAIMYIEDFLNTV